MKVPLSTVLERADLYFMRRSPIHQAAENIARALRESMRDTETGVKIDILLTGDYPGDGQPKPVRFPDPSQLDMRDQVAELPVVPLDVLLTLKLASGMTAAHRLQDLADVVKLIHVNKLSLDYETHLDPYVRPKFRELWQAAQVEEDY